MATINFAEAKAFSINESNLAQIADLDSNSSEWFRETYCQIALTIRKTIEYVIRNQSTGNNSPELNNVIAITGDRGTGKSGVMHSVLRYLEKGNDPTGYAGMRSVRGDGQSHAQILDKLSEKADSNANEFASFTKCTFFTLPTLDPTKLPKEETLVGFIIANIYKKIIKIIESEKDFDPPQFEKIIEKCDKALEALRIRTLGLQTSMKGNPDDLEMLGKLANTSDLRSCLKELIDEYLSLQTPRQEKFFHDSPHSRFLVISIDDLDANVDAGYQLAEELRNYLFIPQVIILMAVKTEQLSDIVQQHFLSVFSEMCKSNAVLDAQPDEMATKYIQKLIPDQRRIHLPSIISYSVNTVSVRLPETNREQSTNIGKNELLLTDYFFSLVRNKSTILLVKNSREGHGLLPMNLRSLHQIIDLLENMPSVTISIDGKIDKDDRINLHNNLRRLSAWIVDSVSSNSIPRNLAVTFRAMAAHPNKGLNGFIVSLLRNYLSSPQCSTLLGSDETAASLVDIKTLPQNISMGDIFFLLNKIEQYNTGEGFIHYVAAIRFLYSIRLTSAYYPVEDDGCQQPDFDTISTLLNGLIYTPTIKLTPTGREWMPNQDSTRFTIKGQEPPKDSSTANESLQPDDADTDDETAPGNNTAPKDNDFVKVNLINQKTFSADGTAMPLKYLVWLSFFAVQYGSRLRKGLPSSHRDGIFLDSRFTPESDAFFGFISFNWLAFIHSALQPYEAVSRMMGYGFSDELSLITGIRTQKKKGDDILDKDYCDLLDKNCQLDKKDSDILDKMFSDLLDKKYSGLLDKKDISDTKKFYDQIITWRKKYSTAVPIQSAEVVYFLINSIEKNRLRRRNQDDVLGRLNEFRQLMISLYEDLGEVLEKTALAGNNDAIRYIILSLKRCPITRFGIRIANKAESIPVWFIN